MAASQLSWNWWNRRGKLKLVPVHNVKSRPSILSRLRIKLIVIETLRYSVQKAAIVPMNRSKWGRPLLSLTISVNYRSHTRGDLRDFAFPPMPLTLSQSIGEAFFFLFFHKTLIFFAGICARARISYSLKYVFAKTRGAVQKIGGWLSRCFAPK